MESVLVLDVDWLYGSTKYIDNFKVFVTRPKVKSGNRPTESLSTDYKGTELRKWIFDPYYLIVIYDFDFYFTLLCLYNESCFRC